MKCLGKLNLFRQVFWKGTQLRILTALYHSQLMKRTFMFCSSLHYLPNCQVCFCLVKLVTNPTQPLFKYVLHGISYRTFKVTSCKKMDKSILEWILFVILSVLAFGFMIWGEVLNKFLLHSWKVRESVSQLMRDEHDLSIYREALLLKW